jgi:hypothetical protein
MEKKRGPGRPRKHETDHDRVKAFRKRKDRESCRIDCYVSYGASNRIDSLSKLWNCSKGDTIDRLIMEAAEKYDNTLFLHGD